MGCAILCKSGCHAENMPQIPCIGDTDMQGYTGTHMIHWDKNQVTGITNAVIQKLSNQRRYSDAPKHVLGRETAKSTS